ncbi:MAG: zinc transporter ZntB [Acidiferrobacterales bacterium]
MAENGLIVAYILDGRGGGQQIGWDGIRAWSPDAGLLWVHLNLDDAAARDWCGRQSGLDNKLVQALLVEESRPRDVVFKNGLLVILRGVNLNPGADPEDMVSLRMWVDQHRVITVRKRFLFAVQDMRDAITNGDGPKSAGEFLGDTTDRLVVRMADVMHDLDEKLGELEDRVATAESHALRPQLASLRREAIMLRRYLAPQRDTAVRLHAERVDWLHDTDRMTLREVADRTTRYVEDLDAARERAAVIQEELISGLSEAMDKRMYLLSIAAVIFLPLGFLTGLLGINVAGIPGSENQMAFAVVSVFLAGVVGFQLWVFRKLRWL